MYASHHGEFAALATAFCWTITALSFEVATKRVGSIVVNFYRLPLAFIFLSVFIFFNRGIAFPVDATGHAWIWLSLSGIVGFVLGDLFLFKSFQIIGSRIAMVIMTIVPPITAIIGWMMMGELLSLMNFLGMGLTIGGIIIVVLNRKNSQKKVKLNHPLKGILFAIVGAVGQAVGLVLSKYGMQQYDPFAATQVRLIAGIIGFSIIVTVFKRWGAVGTALKNTKAMLATTSGSFFGPFLGVSFSLISVQLIATGIASTIMSIIPILIIPPAIIFFKQKVTIREVIGATISVSGVVLFFI